MIIKSLRRSKQAFTLMELIIVLVLMGVLAVFALPRFFDVTADAQEKGLRASLATVRAAINMHRSEQLASGNTNPILSYPTVAEIGSTALQAGNVPLNPWVAANGDTILASTSTTRQVSGSGGWNYNRSNEGEFWANSNTRGENLW